jgi:hypothetical protein
LKVGVVDDIFSSPCCLGAILFSSRSSFNVRIWFWLLYIILWENYVYIAVCYGLDNNTTKVDLSDASCWFVSALNIKNNNWERRWMTTILLIYIYVYIAAAVASVVPDDDVLGVWSLIVFFFVVACFKKKLTYCQASSSMFLSRRRGSMSFLREERGDIYLQRVDRETGFTNCKTVSKSLLAR